MGCSANDPDAAYGPADRPQGRGAEAYVDLCAATTSCLGSVPAAPQTYLGDCVRGARLLRHASAYHPDPSAIEAGERRLFLPGTLEEKVYPYLRPPLLRSTNA